MDQAGQYTNRHTNLFHSSHLPPPSALQLPPPSSFANILPPLSNLSPSAARFPPQQPPPPRSSYLPPPHSNLGTVLPPLPSPAGSLNSWPNVHRTSSSRDDMHPSQFHSQLNRQEQRIDSPVKRESAQPQPHTMHPPDHQHSAKDPESSAGGGEDGMPTTSDFVKKLYKMLEDQSFQHVVSWGPQGDCFVVKDMNEFTKSILPRMFKHSNFASFVRQLNKYDFHKVKNTDDNQFGEHSWMFRHPDFHANRRDALENIKRKVPTQRKQTNPSTNRPLSSTSPGPYPTSSTTQHQVESLQGQVERLTQSQDEMASRIRNLERNYQDVLVEMVGFQRNMAQQDSLMQNLIQYFLQIENGKSKNAARIGASNDTTGTVSDQNPFLPTQEAQRMMGAYPESDVARATLVQMSQISKRAEVAGLSFGADGGSMASNNNGNGSTRGRGMDRPSSRIWAAAANAGLTRFDGPGEGSSSSGKPPIMTRQEALAQIGELQAQRSRPTGGDQRSFGSFNMGSSTSTANMFNTASPEEDSMDEEVVMPSQSTTDLRAADESPPSRSSTASASRSAGIPTIGAWGPGATPDGNETSPGSHQGLQVYTVGHLMPKSNVEDTNGNWSFDANSLSMLSGFPGLIPQGPGQAGTQGQEGDNSGSPFGSERAYTDSASTSPGGPSNQTASSPGTSKKQKLTVRRSTFVPGWAVPPRVLLVDDDAVSRKLSSKFLQVFGCTIDVAMDGVAAVNKMNLEKYDLVLMDIVMPKLDGVSATSLIRKFDHMTPIISMTSNSKPNDIMTYYSSGMNDILPKPFTKEGLLDMLEKHLMHLKVIQQMARIPRSLGIPPLSDTGFEQALTSQAAVMSGPSNDGNGSDNGLVNNIGFSGLSEDDGRLNPLAGMGLTDEQYNAILQNLVNGESFSGAIGLNLGMSMGESSGGSGEKRSLDDPSDSRAGKRSRFEVVE